MAGIAQRYAVARVKARLRQKTFPAYVVCRQALRRVAKDASSTVSRSYEITPFSQAAFDRCAAVDGFLKSIRSLFESGVSPFQYRHDHDENPYRLCESEGQIVATFETAANQLFFPKYATRKIFVNHKPNFDPAARRDMKAIPFGLNFNPSIIGDVISRH